MQAGEFQSKLDQDEVLKLTNVVTLCRSVLQATAWYFNVHIPQEHKYNVNLTVLNLNQKTDKTYKAEIVVEAGTEQT